MKNKNRQSALVVVKTPMQLLNAIEYLFYIGIDTKMVDLFLVNDHKKFSKTLNSLSEKWVWKKKVNYILIKSDNVIGRVISALLTRGSIYLRLSNKYDNIIVGHYSQAIQRFFLRKKGHKVLVDDGIQTLNFDKLRKNELKNGIVETYSPDKTNIFINYIWSFKNKISSPLEIFSSYKIKSNKFDSITLNNFNYFKSKVGSFRQLNSIIFIGSDIVEAGGISEEEYIRALKKLLIFYEKYKLIYIPKKTENLEKLKILKNEIHIKKIDYPIELLSIIEGVVPKIYASFFSSAIFNLSKIFGDISDYVLVDIRSKVMKDVKFDFVFEAYEYHKDCDSSNIKLLE